MSHFYANIQGNRGEATRGGSKASGMEGHIRGWDIGAKVFMDWNKEKERNELTVIISSGSNGGRDGIELGTFAVVNNKIIRMGRKLK